MKELSHMDQLESKSIFIMREAKAKFNKIAMLWSIGKDSTTMLWLAKKAFFGKVPFPVIYIDTGKHFQEMYDFRDECVKKWGLNLIVAKNPEADKQGIGPKDKIKCCGMRKTDALKQLMDKYKFEALLLGIRRDEHGVRRDVRRTGAAAPALSGIMAAVIGDDSRRVPPPQGDDRSFDAARRLRLYRVPTRGGH